MEKWNTRNSIEEVIKAVTKFHSFSCLYSALLLFSRVKNIFPWGIGDFIFSRAKSGLHLSEAHFLWASVSLHQERCGLVSVIYVSLCAEGCAAPLASSFEQQIGHSKLHADLSA